MQVGLVGTGMMGGAMGLKIIEAGHSLKVWNRTKQKAQTLIDLGAVWCDSPGGTADGSEVVISMVTNPEAVSSVTLGADGILAHLPEGAVHSEMSTITPDMAGEMAKAYEGTGRYYLQAPVLGSVPQIAAGTLWVYPGGDPAAIAKAEPVWRSFCAQIWPHDTVQQAAGCKLAFNMMLSHMMLGLGQSLLFASAAGVEPKYWLEMLQQTAMACPMWTNKSGKLLARDFTPNFFIRHMVKDLDLAEQTAKSNSLPIPFTALAREMMITAVAQGWGDEDYSACVKVLELMANRQLG
ncbi:MAG: NAD(P)-dependent oxidoreductase [Armatimonadota bacterium]